MKIAVSPSNGRMMPSSSAALSSRRRLVVPTAINRPPAARAAFSRSAVAASIRPHSACILCSSMSSALTGRKVPAPTCRVSVSRPIPRAFERFEQPLGEMQRGGRRGDRAFLAREHRLIIGAIRLVGRALRSDVRRQRHAPRPLEQDFDRLFAMEMKQRRAVGRSSRPPTRLRPRRSRSRRRLVRAWRCAGTPAIRAAPRACAASRRCRPPRAGLRAAPG